MDELLEQFVLEGRELVQQASDDLLALAQGGTDPALIDSALRAIHTLKGSAGLFDMAPLGSTLHAAEDVMAGWRAARQVGSAETLALLLDCLGAAGSWVEAVAMDERLPEDAAVRAGALVEGLRAGTDGQAATATLAAEHPDWLAQIVGEDPARARARCAALRTATRLFFCRRRSARAVAPGARPAGGADRAAIALVVAGLRSVRLQPGVLRPERGTGGDGARPLPLPCRTRRR